ncbi:hypothetical protein RN001_014767 [Aquatica leii]|uniref:UDP-glucuronosyltransferase n=1 Tax=Aquatica leii TaxID=1421715 RepID=A0AAN7P0Z7_9COLE|nr:hypothetical protein RN001_014767 [Aquatica leii]
MVLISSGNGAKILAVVPTPSYSHQVAFQMIWRELSLRGHQVTAITTNPINDPALVNLTEINMQHLYKSDRKHLKKLPNATFFEFMFTLRDAFEELADSFLSHKPVQDLIKNETEQFDVVMVEYGVLSLFAFSKRFNAPLILMTSLDASSNLLTIMGNPTHPVVYPDALLPLQDNSSLLNRILLVVFSVYFGSFPALFFRPSQQSIIYKYFGTNYPSVEELHNEISLALVNSDPIFHQVKPLLPTVVQFGGGSHRAAVKPLPKELKHVLDAAENGFIYFSLGTNVYTKNLPEHTRNIIVETFAELPFTVIWKFEGHLPNKPKNLVVSKWFPQQDIFKHPKIKLFITQGGLQSTDEAIYDHIPMIGIPFIGDQKSNVNRMVKKGFGLSLDYKTLIKDEFKATILEVINNPKYKNKITELAKLALDQPMTGLERAIWWTDRDVVFSPEKVCTSKVSIQVNTNPVYKDREPTTSKNVLESPGFLWFDNKSNHNDSPEEKSSASKEEPLLRHNSRNRSLPA